MVGLRGTAHGFARHASVESFINKIRIPTLLSQGQSDTLFARFWSQTIRWLAGRDLDQKRSLLTVSTDRPDYELRKTVAIRVVRTPQSRLANARLKGAASAEGEPLEQFLRLPSPRPTPSSRTPPRPRRTRAGA